jgi:hypothetical protein
MELSIINSRRNFITWLFEAEHFLSAMIIVVLWCFFLMLSNNSVLSLLFSILALSIIDKVIKHNIQSYLNRIVVGKLKLLQDKVIVSGCDDGMNRVFVFDHILEMQIKTDYYLFKKGYHAIRNTGIVIILIKTKDNNIQYTCLILDEVQYLNFLNIIHNYNCIKIIK